MWTDGPAPIVRVSGVEVVCADCVIPDAAGLMLELVSMLLVPDPVLLAPIPELLAPDPVVVGAPVLKPALLPVPLPVVLQVLDPLLAVPELASVPVAPGF